MSKEKITQKELDKIRAAAIATVKSKLYGGSFVASWRNMIDGIARKQSPLKPHKAIREMITAMSKQRDTIIAMCDALEAKDKEIELYKDATEILEEAIPTLQKNAFECCPGHLSPEEPCEHCKLSYDAVVAVFMATGRSIDSENKAALNKKGGDRSQPSKHLT